MMDSGYIISWSVQNSLIFIDRYSGKAILSSKKKTQQRTNIYDILELI